VQPFGEGEALVGSAGALAVAQQGNLVGQAFGDEHIAIGRHRREAGKAQIRGIDGNLEALGGLRHHTGRARDERVVVGHRRAGIGLGQIGGFQQEFLSRPVNGGRRRGNKTHQQNRHNAFHSRSPKPVWPGYFMEKMMAGCGLKNNGARPP
jgi:hypothetical protein